MSDFMSEADYVALRAEKWALLTDSQKMDCVLGRIRSYAWEHNISPDQVSIIFEAGVFPFLRFRDAWPELRTAGPEKSRD